MRHWAEHDWDSIAQGRGLSVSCRDVYHLLIGSEQKIEFQSHRRERELAGHHLTITQVF